MRDEQAFIREAKVYNFEHTTKHNHEVEKDSNHTFILP